MAKIDEDKDKFVARNKPVVRCKACITRFEVPIGAKEATCPECGQAWRISWPEPNTPYVRGTA